MTTGSRLRWLDRHHVGLAVALAAVLLRTHRLPQVFASSDAADLADKVAKHVCGDGGVWSALSDLLQFRLGGVQPLMVYAHALLTHGVGGTLDASSWVATTMAVSAVGVFCAYLLGTEVSGKAAGVWAAVLLAVSPIHVMLGRHLGAPWAYEIALQLLAMLLLVKQIRKPSSRRLAALSAVVAVYLWCGNQMLAILPVLAFGALAGYWESERGGFVAYLRSRFLSWWLVLPLASALCLGWLTYAHRKGHLAHALFDKKKELGWHLTNWYQDVIRDLGYGPAWIGLSCVLLALVTLSARRRLLSLDALPLVYFFCYAAPFWVWIGRKTTLTTGYVVYSLTALLILTAVTPSRALGPKRAWHAVPMLSALLLVLGTIAAVYRQAPLTEYLGVRGFQGAYKPNNGAVAAAAFVRQHSGDATSRVFSDASGGGGLEPSIMRLYFRRPTYALYDAPSPDVPYRKFKDKSHRIKYLVIQPKHKKLPAKYFGDAFTRAAEIISGGGKPLLFVYARSAHGQPVKVSVEEGTRLYEELYPKLCSR